MFLRIPFLALYFSPCTLSFSLPLLIHTLSCTIHWLMNYNHKYLILLTKYPSTCDNNTNVYLAIKIPSVKCSQNSTHNLSSNIPLPMLVYTEKLKYPNIVHFSNLISIKNYKYIFLIRRRTKKLHGERNSPVKG